MVQDSVLLVGGSGVLGRQTARWLRKRHPDLPMLIGGRNRDAAQTVASKIGGARAVTLDLNKPRLGLPADSRAAAVVMLAPDPGLNGVRYAQDLGVPYLSIGNGLIEVGAELALFAYRPTSAAIILAGHWFGGPGVFMALQAARAFDSVRAIRIGAVLDENEAAGPAAHQDMEHFQASAPAALVFRNGQRTWLSGDAAKGEIRAIDGRVLQGQAYAPLDIIGLYAATQAPDIRFDIVTDKSSSRVRGGDVAAEIIVEVEGEIGGRARRSRSTLEFTEGQASLTGLSVVLAITAALGAEGQTPTPPGIYLPELLRTPADYLDQLARSGVVFSTQEI